MKTFCGVVAVLCVCVSFVASGPSRSRRLTTTPPPTTPHGACVVDGKLYRDGETISKDPEDCYGSVCDGGHVLTWDDVCFLMGQPECNGFLVDVPGQCCHECNEVPTTMPPTTTSTPSGPPRSCIADGNVYMDGETIHRDPENCYGSVCSGGEVTTWDDKCFLMGQPDCNGFLVDVPGQCCHECVEIPPTTPPTTTSTPSGPPGSCIADGNVYMDGETIHRDPENCYGSVCSGGEVLMWDDVCLLMGQPDCNGFLIDVPGQCCDECIWVDPTPPPTTISTPGGPTGSCIADGNVYMDGETIHRDPENCYGSVCSGGEVTTWDDECFLMGQPDCNSRLVDVPGQCCHVCMEETTTTPPSYIVS